MTRKLLILLSIVGVIKLTLTYVLFARDFDVRIPGGGVGWWWYQDYVVKEREELNKKKESEEKFKPKEKEKLSRNEAKEEKTTVSSGIDKELEEYTYEELLKLPPSKIRALYDYYLERAVENPSDENVLKFLHVVDLMRKKALTFTYSIERVFSRYPELSINTQIPSVGPAIIARRGMFDDYLRKALKKTREYGLIVFVRRNCPYCKVMLDILSRAYENTSVEIKLVDLDADPRPIEKLGISVVPTTYLVHYSTESLHPIVTGVVSVEEFLYRISSKLDEIEGRSPSTTYGMPDYYRGTPVDPSYVPPMWRKK